MSNENIKIALNERKLCLYQGDVLFKPYPVAIGKPATPTPAGEFAVFEKIINPGGILGSRWMGFHIVKDGKYGIHGTLSPELIGRAVSNGCVRMYNHDVEEVFAMVSLGTKVTIVPSLAVPVPQPTGIPGPTLPPVGKAYTVKTGDSLWKIAKQFGVVLSLFISINNLTEPYTIYPGQKLLIP